EHDRTLRAAGVVLAGHVLVGRERAAVGLRTGKNVVTVWRIAAAVNDLALLGQVILFVELVVGAVQIGDAGRNNHAFGIRPRTFADAVARIHGAGALRGQIGMPGLAAGARGFRQILAVLVGAGEPAKIGAFAAADAGDKEAHIGLLRLRRRRAEERKTRRQWRSRSLSNHRKPPDIGEGT